MNFDNQKSSLNQYFRKNVKTLFEIILFDKSEIFYFTFDGGEVQLLKDNSDSQNCFYAIFSFKIYQLKTYSVTKF